MSLFLLALVSLLLNVCPELISAAPKVRLRYQNLMVDALSRARDIQYQDLGYKVDADYKLSGLSLRSPRQLAASGFRRLRSNNAMQVISARLLERDGAEYDVDFAYDPRTHLLQSEHVYQVGAPRSLPSVIRRHAH